jgi:MoCo/4Fe-4S cofactor protein with predicted Tat translocation signal
MQIKDTFPELYQIRKPLKLVEVQQRLSAAEGKEYWRSLEELAASEDFEEMLHREFPRQAGEWNDEVGRRTFLKLMAASLALAGISGCSYQPPETIVPYVRQPEEIIPGQPLYFATAMTLGGAATGLLVRSNMGRPTKVEGNPDHPASLGATDLYAQASILSLYDPDRSQTIAYRGDIRSWTAFLAEIRTTLEQQRNNQGAGIRILTETVTSPTLAAQLHEILAAFPNTRWHQYEPCGSDGARAGARLAFSAPVNTVYRFEQAERILSLDSDFLSCGPASLRYAKEYARKRRPEEGRTEMNRLYAVETTPTNTGARADHRLSIRPSQMEAFARAIASALGAQGAGAGAAAPAGVPANWIPALVKDLQAHQGRSLVIAGDEQSATVHALAHAINQALGNVGKTVVYTDPIEFTSPADGDQPPSQMDSLRALVGDMDAGRVEMLFIVGGNPVYNAPADFQFAERLKKVKLRIHLSLYDDETSALCHWHIPQTHYLEAWSDARAYDGTVSIVQPLIAPLFRGKSAHELLATLSDRPDRSSYEIVREYWQGQRTRGGALQAAGAGGQATSNTSQATAASLQTATASSQTSTASEDFEQWWRKALHDGVVPDTALPSKSVSFKADWANQAAQPQSSGGGQGYELVFRADPTVYDGRFANNGWLQELPKPLTKLTWDNAAMMSPATARRFGFGVQKDGATINRIGTKGGEVIADVATLRYKGQEVTAPVLIVPGQPDNVITVHLGYGRTRAGRAGTSLPPDNTVGFNAYKLRTSDAPWFGTGLEVQKQAGEYTLAFTQIHFALEGRDKDILQTKTLVDYVREQQSNKKSEAAYDESLYPPYNYAEQPYAWGMAIDNSSCVGCSACVVACQAENNIPVVGKEQVVRSREMHWLRVDTYYKGPPENPTETHFMPLPCMHCEAAPCEPVCPVHATVHSAEGTNDMVYNRCVGTRYCSNNCPYKVRRFNFLLYQDWETPTYKLMRNPEVSVRSRGVMEKCTYCIQRIQYAKIESEKENRLVRDGEIQTACQSVCPTEAIVFGNVNDPNSRVSKLKHEHRNYSVLPELNTKPRTTYLASLRNPNPEIKA